ncbi:glycosyltransferase family 2 protein [Rhodoflexus caldus]|uniref:glycosyltransferase family 2 protein n=1 Tax=Rhodoflexus caldus TaxID=2891236 RepID=UPI00202ABEC0|nr:glycosyltransferase family 2 protein [Rhodoflexus caldus]
MPPLCSIITVTYNAAAALRKTMESVAALTFTNFEWIVVDGASKDETIALLTRFTEQHPHIHMRWVSEKDRGIYDAMNKGINLAQGQWVCLMNAGDVFHSPQVLSQIFADGSPAPDVIYGNYHILYPYGFAKAKHTPAAPPPLWQGMVINHQSLLIRTEWAQRFPYRLDSIAADYIQLATMLTQGAVFQHVDIFIADYEDGGQSSQRKERYLTDCRDTALQLFPEKATHIQKHFKRLLKQHRFNQSIQSILPPSIFYWLMRTKYFLMKFL